MRKGIVTSPEALRDMLKRREDAGIDEYVFRPCTEQIEKAFSAEKAHWMLRRGRNLMVFPNLVLNDLASTHLRTHRPLAPDRAHQSIRSRSK